MDGLGEVGLDEARLLLEDFLSLCQQRIHMEGSSMRTELEMMALVQSLEEGRKKWLQAELELKTFKELLVKSDVSKAALEVKLKHTRNQLDLEMKKRHKVESDYHYLQRQMQLMCDILVHDSKSSACLNDEQKSLLATFEHKGTNVTMQRSCKRLTAIDESSFLSHSDISYDRTDDEVDLDTTMIKPLRSRARERRRSSMGLATGALVGKRNRGGNVSAELMERQTVEKEVETIVKAVVRTPDTGGLIPTVGGTAQEHPDRPAQKTPQESAVSGGGPPGAGDLTSVWAPCDYTVVESGPDAPPQDVSSRIQKTLKHVFLSKTVIRPETCVPCGKRVRFGKGVVKCRNCRVVAHPECKEKLTHGCCSTGRPGGPAPTVPDLLEGSAPATHPRVPQLVVDCVAEIERRGLQERGLYRIPGGERAVRELKERCLQGGPALSLGHAPDVHVVCGVLKDFLRKLREPLLTFRLHRTFMEAAELSNHDDGAAVIRRAVAELPKANRDTLAFLMLHLHKVMRSPPCQMDQNNLARVFGPTIVGHGMSEPSPTTIMRDTNTQPKVVCRLLSIPEDFWKRVLAAQTGPVPFGKRVLTAETGPVPSGSNSNKPIQDEGHGRWFQPVTSPELNNFQRSQNPASVLGRIRNLGTASTARPEPGRRFFTSPS